MTYGNLQKMIDAGSGMSDLERSAFEANLLGRLCANVGDKEFEEILERAKVSFVKVSK